ncbi:TrmB family transcriptional regulator sugar-binding domain-containing protein [Haloarcula sp. GH36]|uniref:TrmB family transcriptional regulator sugar-binding domain-containing protein n=1 Tax=Haloarcula montana TaxID=3111776 RepID=UPI002D795E05|nr:TrmB family transcriptional regulator sugar-binding domain-containing protein [Haloarcula sp. GH36]
MSENIGELYENRSMESELQKLGLSKKEANVYMTIIEYDQIKPTTLASESDVSTSYVYEICDKLAERGLVTVHSNRTPMLVCARPPTEAFNDIRSELSNLEGKVETYYETPTDQDTPPELIRSRQTLKKQMRSIINESSKSILMMMPVTHLSDFADALRQAVEDGVFVLLVLHGEISEVTSTNLQSIASAVRFFYDTSGVLLVADGKQGIVGSANLLNWGQTDRNCISLTNRFNTVLIGGAFMSVIWQPAHEVLIPTADQLPNRYNSWLAAVLNATIHLRCGNSIAAQVSGYYTGSSKRETETISGEIIETTQNILYPQDGGFGTKNSLLIDTGETTVSVGSEGAYVEDFASTTITLYPL